MAEQRHSGVTSHVIKLYCIEPLH